MTAHSEVDDADATRVQLIEDILAERERVSGEVADRLQAEMESYRALPANQPAVARSPGPVRKGSRGL